ncbi:Oidioi.mRNA.OKI2018_I69.chr1.g2776.t1.cds [Oikopleura dioica]|uniref:Oidioi.mRNA.OKI2018_I69.chr1.g2776.t1.cds n=1 Tax=Oikopleura dioica TaxID=34765 RepID=A0ABN7SXJ7_OIKDI|nr:Oidioi.mRNA.OKI2018_I69.chr1.g2776.t1.cds [Oikopleura dioica]
MKSYFLYLSLSGASLTSSKSKRTNLSRWMTDLPDAVRERSILELAIPGSHDSFAYTLDKKAPFSQNSEGLDDIFDQIGIDKVDEIAKEITYNWAITQILTTQEQLEAGIRYFDYRTMPLRPSREEVYNAHSLYGPSTEYEMMQIWSFLRDNPGELVIVNFNHFYDMDQKHYDWLEEHLRTLFGDKICDIPEDPLSTLSFNDIKATNCNVIILYGSSIRPDCINSSALPKNQPIPRPDFAWNKGSNLSDPWLNKQDKESLFSGLDSNLEKGRPLDKFYGSQALLTAGRDIYLSDCEEFTMEPL